MRGMPVSSVTNVSPEIQAVVDMLDTIDGFIDMFPPHEKRLRFGNGAFVEFYEHLEATVEDLHTALLPVDKYDAIPELSAYLTASVGQPERIDYGTGHELSFLVYLFCLVEMGFISLKHADQIGLVVFNRYLRMVRRLQALYCLEPAGSHGVWGLDDYQHLPFFFGASQLIDNPMLKPSDIHDRATIMSNADEYLYFDAVKSVTESKSAYLAECAPMLNDISAVKTWAKISEGMFKMWKAEVLDKYVVVQHLLFGSMLSWGPQN